MTHRSVKVVDQTVESTMTTPALLRHASEPRRIQITLLRHLSSKTADTALAPGPDQQAQSLFDNGALRPPAAAAHRLTHQGVVDINIRSHRGP
jgi:hypothetical protein